jgi:hypothetical protein
MKKRGRGSYEEFSCKFDSITLNAVKWYDNKPVHLLSNFVAAHPTSAVQRLDSTRKEKIDVECASIVFYYNKCMGVLIWWTLWWQCIASRSDQRSGIWELHFNAWLLYRRDCTGRGMNKTDQLSLLDFKSSVAACLCKQNKEGLRKRGRPSSSVECEIQLKKIGPCASLPEKEVRMDGMSHSPQFTEKRGSCKKPRCTDAPKVLCTKYKVHLCFTANSNCFIDYHTKQFHCCWFHSNSKDFFQIYSVIFMFIYATFVRHYIEKMLFQTFHKIFMYFIELFLCNIFL